LPEEFTGVADHVVVGEAESIIEDLVEGRIDEKVVQGERVSDLESLPRVNYMFAVFMPRNMSAVSLQTATYNAYQRFYSVRRTALDALRLGATVLLDAAVWTLSNSQSYKLDVMLLRGGTKALIAKSGTTLRTYLSFLREAEKRRCWRTGSGPEVRPQVAAYVFLPRPFSVWLRDDLPSVLVGLCCALPVAFSVRPIATATCL
jgi:hypothetical protein